MPQRNLTSNAAGAGGGDSANPFASELDNSESSPSSFSGSEGHSRQDSISNQGQNYAPYSGFYTQNGTTSSNLLSRSSSKGETDRFIDPSNQSPNPDNYNDAIHVASEFDRYPFIAGSRVVSSTSLASQFRNMAPKLYKSSSSNDDASTKSSDPFVSNVDFSPFGGYPASSFPLHIDEKENDDYLHNPDPIADAEYDKNRFMYDLKYMDRRSFLGLLGFLIFLVLTIVIFIILPVLTYSGITNHAKPESYEILTQYQYPLSAAIRTSLIDPDTPSDARTKTTNNGENWVLTFSDEFNIEGRTFYEGDDQFFQAVDIHYDATKDLEWYDPDAVTTANGTLVLRLDAYKNHNLFYRSGMLQSWNKLCFTQGAIEVSAMMPNYGNISGLWPGLWTMGNLARPGYLSTAQGVWPYSYDSCDAGITANQSSPDGISYLPGQKLSVCTCPGEDHPNVGTGRGAPEIDIIEGAIDTTIKNGVASQSVQVAPMDIWYVPDYNFLKIHNKDVTSMNTYTGGPVQQAVSGITTLNVTWYQYGDHQHNFQTYGFEYLNDNDSGYITWYVGRNPTFTMEAYALGPNGNINHRRISKEPMSIIMNLGVSNNWAYIDWPSIHFPSSMQVDYVRVYQPEEDINMSCDTDDYPTAAYIEAHKNSYYNVNSTTWEEAGYTFPKNKLVHGCR